MSWLCSQSSILLYLPSLKSILELQIPCQCDAGLKIFLSFLIEENLFSGWRLGKTSSVCWDRCCHSSFEEARAQVLLSPVTFSPVCVLPITLLHVTCNLEKTYFGRNDILFYYCRELIAQAHKEKRVLLTRDAKLLRHKYLLQNQIYRVNSLLKNEQLLEVCMQEFQCRAS